MNPVRRLESDLRACGMPRLSRAPVCDRYARALETGNHGAWEHFYRELFCAMNEVAARSSAPPDCEALNSVMLILEDDLGCKLFDARRLGELRSALRRPAAAVNV